MIVQVTQQELNRDYSELSVLSHQRAYSTSHKDMSIPRRGQSQRETAAVEAY